MKKRVLVTGATGFLGGYLVDELNKHGYEVLAFGRNRNKGIALEREGVVFYEGDFTKSEDLRPLFEKGINLVVHAGALSTVWGAWQDFYETNVLGTKNLLELCSWYGIERLVYISSPSIYAAGVDQLDIREEEAPLTNRLSYYIQSKLASEQLFASYPSVDSVILRPRGLFGIGDTSIIPRVLQMSQKVGIPLVGDGEHVMDMTCVENVAFASRLALESPKAVGQVYNITNGEPKTFRETIELFLTKMELPIRYRKLPRALLYSMAWLTEMVYRLFSLKGEPFMTRYTYYLLRYSQTLNIEKARKDLGYYPQISIEEGIEQYAKHYRKT